MENQMILAAGTFSDNYLQFRRLCTHSAVREEEYRVRVPEKVVRCAWNDQLFKTKELQTTRGERLEVIFPGFWSFGKGPDFTAATIKVNGKTYTGDVEIHTYSNDWKTHKHSLNPDFDNVILHVFLWKNHETETTAQNTAHSQPSLLSPQIFELEVKSFLAKGALEISDSMEFDNYPAMNPFNYGLCHEPLSGLPRKKLEHLLNLAGEARILAKASRFNNRVITHGYEQTFYEGLAEALGYPSNKKPFRHLAEMLPLSALKELLPGNLAAPELATHLQAVFFGIAGLLGGAGGGQSAATSSGAAYFSQIQKLWTRYRARTGGRLMLKTEWTFAGIRPANYPYRRIAGLSHLLSRHWHKGVFVEFIEHFKSLVSISPAKGYNAIKFKPLLNFFCVEAGDYWADHYVPAGKKLASPQQLIGPARSREIAVNILLPLLLIYARASKSKHMEVFLNLMYQSAGNPAENRPLRFMKRYVLGGKREMLGLLASDKQAQGLLQVYQDYCTQNENNCSRCRFPEVINRYFL